MKKILSAILILTMLCSLSPVIFAEPTTDTVTKVSTAKNEYTQGEVITVETSVKCNGTEDVEGATTALKLDSLDATELTGTTIDTSDLSVGQHTIYAIYAGNDTYKPSNGNKEITVKEAQEHKITIKDTITNGTVSASVSSAKLNTVVTLTLSPKENFGPKTLTGTYSGGTVEMKYVNPTTYSFIMPDADVEVDAEFNLILYGVSVAELPPDSGTVSCDPANIRFGQASNLQAESKELFYFYKWDATNGVLADESNPTTTVTPQGMSGISINVKALFIEGHVAVEDPTKGSATIEKTGNNFEYKITATPNDNPETHFWKWEVTGNATVGDIYDKVTTLKLNGQDATATASFKLNPTFRVNVTATEGGTAKIKLFNDECVDSFKDDQHTPIKINATPDEGYLFSGWTQSDSSNKKGIFELDDNKSETTKFHIGATDETLTANFEPIPPVSSVSVLPTEVELSTSGTTSATLSSTVLPEKAIQTVEWSSEDPTVATVLNGVVTAVSKGITTVTVKSTADPTKTASCKVYVDVDKSKAVTVPTSSDFEYDAAQHSGVPAGTGYTLSGETTAVNAGTYNVTAKLEDGYYWADETVGDKNISWKITKKPIAVPEAITGLVYSGSLQTGVAEDSEKYLFENSSNKATDAGSYIAKATPTANYCWNDAGKTSDTKEISWTISKLKVSPPPAIGSEYEYDGKDHKPVAEGTGYYTVTYSATQCIEAGNYSAVIALMDKDNTTWEDGTSADLTYSYHVGYGITFDGNGGTPSVSKLITNGSRTLGGLPTASRNGYSFGGWYTDKTGGTFVNNSTVFNANTTVFAHWVPNSYTVSAGKIIGGTYGRAYVSFNGGYNWTEITSTTAVTLGSFQRDTQIWFKIVPYSGYYAHPYVYYSNGSFYSPAMNNYIFTITVTDNMNVKLNFSSSPATGDASMWQYVVAALSSAGLGTGIVLSLKKKRK